MSVYLNEHVSESVLVSLFQEMETALKHFQSFQATKVSHQEYLAAIKTLKADNSDGNIYEINYCQEFYREQVEFNPYAGYLKLRV